MFTLEATDEMVKAGVKLIEIWELWEGDEWEDFEKFSGPKNPGDNYREALARAMWSVMKKLEPGA